MPFACDRHKLFQAGEAFLGRGSFASIFEITEDFLKQYYWNSVTFEGTVASNSVSWPNNFAKTGSSQGRWHPFPKLGFEKLNCWRNAICSLLSVLVCVLRMSTCRKRRAVRQEQ